jgi:Fe2+ or Zn2+ uptake regulation protein
VAASVTSEHIGLTTIYRHLQVLTQADWIDAIRDTSGETFYRKCSSGIHHHHHHLTCRNCGRSVETEDRAVERWAAEVAAKAGYTDVGHTVELLASAPNAATHNHPDRRGPSFDQGLARRLSPAPLLQWGQRPGAAAREHGTCGGPARPVTQSEGNLLEELPCQAATAAAMCQEMPGQTE